MRKSPLLFITTLILLFAGCDPSGTDKTESNISNNASGGPISYPVSDYVEQERGETGGTLRISTTTDTSNLNPHGVSAGYIQWLGRILFDNLVYFDEKGDITPWLAKSWEISPDRKTYTFYLRDDVTFSDGTKFNAEAVLINLEHMRDPATKSPLAAAYIAPYAEGKVVDEYTFEAHLTEPYTPFLEVLAQSWLAMISPKQIRENPKAIAEAPIGSGPFVLESYTRQQGIRFVKRKDYHWAPAFIKHDGPAYLDRIAIDFVSEALLRYTSLVSGQYDFTLDAPPQNAAAIRADQSLSFDSRIRKGIPSRGLTFNVSQPPFDDANIRKALALSIDRDGITQLIGFGEYKPKTDFLAANTRYYDSSFQNALQYNPAEAARLFDAAGWKGRDAEGYRTKDGKRLIAEVLAAEAATPSPVVVAIQSDAKKAGFDLRIVQIPMTQIVDRRNANKYQALAGGVWHTNTPDALYIVYHSNEIISEKRVGQNISRLQDPELDSLLTQAREAGDPAVLQGLYSKAQKRLTEIVPAVTLYENYVLTAWRSDVKGVIFDTSHNTPFFPSIWLKKKDK